jgi:hypothetical protein
MTTINTILPLSLETMKQVVTTTNVEVVVDYTASQIKGRSALIYLTNANIPNVRFTVSTAEEAFELIDCYIMHKSTINIDCLCASIVRLLLAIKAVELSPADEESIDGLSLISPDDVGEYLMDDKRRINLLHLIHVLDNIPTCLYATSPEFVKNHGAPETVFPVVNTLDYIGYTFVNLVSMESFLIAYYSVPTTAPVVFFKQQFTEYAFGGKNLFAYLTNTFMVPVLSAVAAGTLTVPAVEVGD